MKYLSLNTIIDSYKGCKGKTQNKFWGLLAILKALDKDITSGVGYPFQTSEVSYILDNLFNLNEGGKDNRRGDVWSVLFSRRWLEVIPEIMFDETPNIYYVASWFFRKSGFPDDFDTAKLISLFLNTFHFSIEDANYLFDMKTKVIEFAPYLYSNDDFISRIKESQEIPQDAKCISFENSGYLKSNAGGLGQASFVQTLYSAQGPQKCLILTQFDFNEEYKNDSNIPMEKELQQIFYGAPGTGKSNTIKRDVDDKGKTNFRVTFHPDSDYSTFVGCYKPTMKVNRISKNGVETKEEQIVYRFVPQAFTKAYTAAWNTEDDVYLIIEEINRGNCAQIFGDLFQLLDTKNGVSEYPVDADTDLADYICKNLKNSSRTDFPVGVKEGKKLVLPSNLYIWATMNTSDQSLFPIDSAFKRRWDWKYMKIKDEGKNWVVKFDYEEDGKPYTFECSWWQFILAINEKIANATSSDDKKLGYFFCKPKTQDSKVIDAERFVGKVIFYLWNDVFKDEDNAIFKVIEGKSDPSFDGFYTEDGDGKTIADTKALRAFMHNVFGEQSELFTETAKNAETVTE